MLAPLLLLARTTNECVPDVASISAAAGVPSVPDVLTVAGFPALAGVADVTVIPAVDGIFAVASRLSDCNFFLLSNYRISDWRIRETVGLSDIGSRRQTIGYQISVSQ